ncbi:hypothetical protein PAXINDRAFT_157717 [Paxillus involutus ATCC 200175]|uniref:Uncharacterized protein n=1 Tax=Paxillus involutus ATCC 200175 TaxID=664439 RepID=A0A0C9TS85_PAXIN|nr:hypothetical protein PAXINDRAFT_157717 [Paxillus involutus ATCC 200175]
MRSHLPNPQLDAVLHLLSMLTLNPVDVQQLADAVSDWLPAPGLPESSPSQASAPAITPVASTTASTTNTSSKPPSSAQASTSDGCAPVDSPSTLTSANCDLVSASVEDSPTPTSPTCAFSMTSAGTTQPTPPSPGRAPFGTVALPPASTNTNTSQAATTLHHLPVTTVIVGGEAQYQHTYRGFAFDIPWSGSLRPFYLVTRGWRIGVFATWPCTSPYVLGISCSSYTRVQTLGDGLLRMLDAIDLGEAQWLAKICFLSHVLALPRFNL